MRALFVCLLSLAGCSNEFLYRPKERTYEDKIDGRRITELREILLDSRFGNGFGFSLGVTRVEHRTGTTLHGIELTYFGGEWLFIREHESLVFLADGQRIALSTLPNGITRDVSDRNVVERVTYPITSDELRVIARAGTVDAKIVSDRGYEECRLHGKAKEAFRAFVEREIG